MTYKTYQSNNITQSVVNTISDDEEVVSVVLNCPYWTIVTLKE
ncbi:hypothetical protein [Methanobrevibacter curvatus]|uniref:Uncharacterized protein n=1 Tax=Methanobrevibacter curvatus TaxID=49547 RepID=A0A166CAY1_9EURY|nr:hypothetical protein [Methanobrevibacter curvatus]KZX14314.1 hypothetical protein MBCUR_05380 [Methanobrevibacter curvatus]